MLTGDKYEILPDGNWYSFVKNGQRYYISYLSQSTSPAGSVETAPLSLSGAA